MLKIIIVTKNMDTTLSESVSSVVLAMISKLHSRNVRMFNFACQPVSVQCTSCMCLVASHETE